MTLLIGKTPGFHFKPALPFKPKVYTRVYSTLDVQSVAQCLVVQMEDSQIAANFSFLSSY